MALWSRKCTKRGSLAASCVVALVFSVGLSAAIGDVPPDFSLTDVNATSATSGESVSPRDYLQQVSGWYFGHAT